MANETQKYFLDLVGLTTVWNKIKATFADKEETNSSISNINTNIANLDEKLKVVDNDVTNLENTVLTIAPREVDYYNDALELSKSLVVGTTIKVNKTETSADDETPSGYSTGIYIVTGPGEIKYISTSDGDADASDITALGNRVDELEETVITSAEIVNEKGEQLNQSLSVSNNILLIAHDDSFDIDSESVRALTHRAVAAKFRSIENVITQIPKFNVSVVDELPTTNISLSTIYLLRNSETYTNNLFSEYIYVEREKDNPETPENESKFVWEKLGEQSLVVDDIITVDQLNQILSNTLHDYAKKTDVQDLLNTAVDGLKNEIYDNISKTYATIETVEAISNEITELTDELENYITKDDAALTYLSINDAKDIYLSKDDADNKGWVTEDDVLVSIQTGNIGNAIVITEEQIEEIITKI